MRILKSLIANNLQEGTDLSQLPADVLKAIKSNIRKGAEDLEQKWANALELVHKAYEIEGAERPTPDMKEGWKQYEEQLAYAVEQLAKSRGMDGDWRMSSSIFHEALTPKARFRVKIDDDEFITEDDTIEAVIVRLTENVDYETITTKKDGAYHLSFYKYKVKQNTKVTIEPI